MGSLDNTKSGKGNPGKREIKTKSLVLHNDDVNTFEHVIQVLQKVCEHDKIQAEQCALLTHSIGYCEIKRGKLVELNRLKKILLEKSLDVTID